VIAAAGLTLFRLGDSPPGLFIDEVAISMTARSLWENGTDLIGEPLPLYPYHFPEREVPTPVNPLFAYAGIPFALAGPGAWSARLPAVMWLWAAAAGIGLCAFELTRSRSVGVAIGSAAALSPWLFVLGRVGWEAVSFPATTALALWMFLRGGRTGRGRDYALSGALFGLSLYAYTTARLLVPLTVAAAAAIYGRRGEARRHAWRFALPLAALAAPLAVHLLRHPGVLTWRFAEAVLWKDGADPQTILLRFLSHYVGYFSPRFLFLAGDANIRHGTGRGVLLWAWAPILLVGLWQAWRRRREPTVQLVVAGLLIAPLGASLVMGGQPHAIRSLTAVLFWSGIAAMGLGWLLSLRPRGRAIAAALAFVAAIDAGAFLLDYFGAYRDRAFESFDSGKGAILKIALEKRAGRALYVPRGIDSPVRERLLVAYWAGLPTADLSEEALIAHGIHAWEGEAPPGSLIVVDRRGPMPAAARPVLTLSKGGEVRYRVFEN